MNYGSGLTLKEYKRKWILYKYTYHEVKPWSVIAKISPAIHGLAYIEKLQIGRRYPLGQADLGEILF